MEERARRAIRSYDVAVTRIEIVRLGSTACLARAERESHSFYPRGQRRGSHEWRSPGISSKQMH